MKFTIIALTLLLTACGKSGGGGSQTPVGIVDQEGYIPVAQAYMKITQGDSSLANLSFIQSAYAATIPVNYVIGPNSTFTLNTAGISPIEDGDILDVGQFVITQLSTNQLRICGAGGNQKCNQAVIRVYTQPLVGFESLPGFVNTTDGYSLPASVNGLDIGLTSNSAAIIEQINIPNNLNRLRISDFTALSNQLEVDISNAGVGNYEMIVVVELALALI